MDDRNGTGDLEQAIRDERARRKAAESRIEELTQRADLWRTRAEERSERITRLLEAQAEKDKPFGSLRKFLKRDSNSAAEAKPGQERRDEPEGSTIVTVRDRADVKHWPSIKSVMVISAVSDPGMARCLSAFDETPLSTADSVDMENADLVVVEPAALAGMPTEIHDRLTTWSRETGRQSLVVWTNSEGLSNAAHLLRAGDRVVSTDIEMAGKTDISYLPGCFDPAWHRPSPSERVPSGFDGRAQGSAESRVEPRQFPSLVGRRDLLAAPPLWVVEAAAMGDGLDTTPGSGVAARRWAYRHHAPWVRASQLLDLVGLRAPNPIPRIAAILISNRPASIPSAVAAVLRQTHGPTELVVGVHGGEVTSEIVAALSAASVMTELLTLNREDSLGDCLNQAIAMSSASLVAKIDDDDHYGPAHLEDSFHSLAYSGADIVGKGAQYTYVASRDVTVLRRPGQEETLIDGSPNGATLVFRRSVWEEVGFPNRPRHVDTGFLRAAREVGATVYAGSRWEFCYVRNPEGHTWEAEDSVFLAGAEPAWEGFHPDRVEVSDLEPL